MPIACISFQASDLTHATAATWAAAVTMSDLQPAVDQENSHNQVVKARGQWRKETTYLENPMKQIT